MALGGYINNGVKIAYSISSPLSWLRLGQVLEAPVLGISREKVDSTVHGNSQFMRSMPGMIEVQDFAMKLLGDLSPSTSAAHEAMRTYTLSGATIWFRIEIPVDRSQTQFRAFEFQAWVQEWMVNSSDPKSRNEIDVTVVFDSDSWTVYAPGASAIS